MNKEDVLRQLDEGAEGFDFPMLDNGFFYHGDQKMTIYRDDKRWAMVVEIIAFLTKEENISGITTISSVFGNCVSGKTGSPAFKNLVEDADEPTFLYDEDNFIPYLNPDASQIKVRGTFIPINSNKSHYHKRNIQLAIDNKITPWAFMRGLVPEQSHLFWMTKDEVFQKIPSELSEFIILSHWHHPNLIQGEKPSDTETFRQLGLAIETGDKSQYNPKEKENTHWSNWPFGGSI